jgi:capsular exopolysaccharide synthesis family protein
MKIPFLSLFSGNGAPIERESSGYLLNVGEEDSVFRETFRSLRSKLEYKADMIGWKVFGVTSAIAGEGKTLTCAKLAVSMASTKRKRVLLVDADVRKGSLSRGMGIPAHPGLTEFLLGSETLQGLIRQTAVQGLSILSSGTSISEPADVLSGDRFRVFVEEVREGYDVVLLDCPPVLPVADAMSIRELMDGFIFIYRAGLTPLNMFQQATEEIGEKKILGVVLNGVEPKSDRYYGKYYGSYYISPKSKDPQG